MAAVGAGRAGAEVLSTGFLGLDLALGTGGFPRGRSVELFGAESSGKRTLALQAAAELQRQGGVAVFIGAKYALDANYAHQLGVNLDDLLVSVSDSGERTFEIADILVRSGGVDLMAIHSAAPPEPRAREVLAELDRTVRHSRTAAVFINAGGDAAFEQHAAIRLNMSHAGLIMKGREVIGDQSRIAIVKNDVTSTLGEVQLDVVHGAGISREADVIDQGVRAGVLEKCGAGLRYGNTTLGYTRLQMCEFLAGNPGVCLEIRQRVSELARKPLQERRSARLPFPFNRLKWCSAAWNRCLNLLLRSASP